MKAIIFLLLFVHQVAAQPSALNDPELIPVRKNNQWQYITSTGSVVIPGPFHNAFYFSDGLAAVRSGGLFGFINAKGEFIISPQYDFADSFESGFARVVKDGDAMVINRAGTVVFKPKGKFGFTEPALGHIVLGNKKRVGLYNLAGNWTLKRKYKRIQVLGDSLYLVFTPAVSYDNRRSAVFHLARGFITEFQRAHDYVVNFDGSISFKTGHGDKEKTLLLNDRGKEVFKFYRPDVYTDGSSEEGFIKYSKFEGDDDYVNYINTKGETLFKDGDLRFSKPFRCGRAFVKFRTGAWRLIDKKGQVKSENEFDEVDTYFTKSGSDLLCAVSQHGKWGLIDSNGLFLISPQYKRLDVLDAKRGICLVSKNSAEQEEYNKLNAELRLLGGDHGGGDQLDKEKTLAVLKTKIKTFDELFETHEPSDLYGLVDKTGKPIVDCRYKDLAALPSPDVYYVMNDSVSGIMHLQHGIVYSEETSRPSKKLDTLNIDYMERGYCYAASAFDIYTNLGGHGSSHNNPRFGVSQFARDKQGLFLWVDTLTVDTFYQRYAGHPLYLVNKTADTVLLDAQDGRLYITMQALVKGEWKNIEYSPSSWCGNSYHTVGLLSGLYWKFSTPVYKGGNKVQLRFKLIGDRRYNSNKKEYEEFKVLYSNVFCGSINPAQLWKKKGHSPTGIMDPYNE